MPARTIAVGDVHGCDVALEALLEQIAPKNEDVLIFLGDVVDTGPNTRRAVDVLLDLSTACELILLRGNHDEIMLYALESGAAQAVNAWKQMGGRETLDSYDGRIENVPEAHIKFLKSSIDYHETPTEIFVHANLEPGVPIEKQTTAWLRWCKLTGDEQPHPSGRRVVCGHSSQKSGRPLVFEGWVCIDTRAYEAGCLTALDVATNQTWHANQSGKSWTANLDEFR